MIRGLTLRKIAEVCRGSYYGDPACLDLEVENVVTDSRQAKEGSLFAAIPGERVDWHKFIPDVFAKGARAVLSERELENPADPYILVENSLMAIRHMAAWYRQTLTIPVIGITGSVGKTSTKEMIASVLEQKFKVLKTEGNFNNLLGMPMTLLKIRDEHEVAVVEMGISEFGEMHQLAEIARPDICVITNIGQAHLENLKSRDGILQAKTEIFDFLTEKSSIILNGDDDKLALVGTPQGIRPWRFFVLAPDTDQDEAVKNVFENPDRTHCSITVSNIENLGLDGLTADLRTDLRTVHIREPIPGMHYLHNAGAAACVGRVLGLTNEEIAAGIASVKTISGRLNMVRLRDGIVVIDDCYNANPASMKASLHVLGYATGRKIAVLGDMGELGENEKELHAQVGTAVVENGIDVLFCAGELCREMANAAAGCGEVKWFADRDSLQKELLPFVKPGDSILVKASHFMGFPVIVEALRDAIGE